MDFHLPENFFAWHPTCHNIKLSDGMIETFLNTPAFRKLSGNSSVWYAANLEIMDYVKAIRSLRMSADGKALQNPFGAKPYFTARNEKLYGIGAGESLILLE